MRRCTAVGRPRLLYLMVGGEGGPAAWGWGGRGEGEKAGEWGGGVGGGSRLNTGAK